MFINPAIIFIFGLAVGSFLNVLIDRIPKGKDIIFKRSHCDHCQRELKAFDLIPLLSYLLLRGKCRYCRKKISGQNPLVETATGLIFVFIAAQSANKEVIYQLAVAGILIAIFAIDFKDGIIPDSLIIFLISITFIFQILSAPWAIFANLATGLILAVFFLLLVILTRGRGMGLGDVKYAFFMGFYLGFPLSIAAFYVAFLTGAVISLILILLRKKTLKSRVAFGPFLVTATLISRYFGIAIINFFQRLML